jgi:hypothetical protein
LAKILIINKTYANNAAKECAKAFFAVFFIKKKAGPRKKNAVCIIFFNCL